MQREKPLVLVIILLLFAVLLIPSILVLPFSSEETSGKLKQQETVAAKEMNLETLLVEASPIDVSVYRTEKDEVETLPLEEYVVGVVASEMPIEFEEEALKAQSLTARTFIVKQLLTDADLGMLKGADIGDTVNHQVFKSDEELKEQWGLRYKKNIEKIRRAVYETRGQIIVYDNQPITAAFFSTSNGYTENSEAYWSTPLPYLVSVESPWDLASPKFMEKRSIPVSEFEAKLGVQVTGNQVGEILEYTPGKRVAKVSVGGRELTGREIRDKLGLKSADFTWERVGDEIIITTKGYGHGIGMSQYGANGMAQEGKSYEEIIKYYYQGVEIQDASQYLSEQVANQN